MNSRDSDDSRVPKTPGSSKQSVGGASRRKRRPKKRATSVSSKSASPTTARESTVDGSSKERAGLWGRMGRPKEWGLAEWGSLASLVGIPLAIAGFLNFKYEPFPSLPEPPDIKICEVVADPPDGIEPDDEEIVLCNYENETVTLGGWTLQDNHGKYLIPVGEVIEPEGEWRVEGRTMNPNRSGTKAIWLANKGDFVVLYDPKDREVDRVHW